MLARLKFTLAILALVLGYIWVMAPMTPRWVGHLVTLAVLGLSAGRAARTGEWGLRSSELLPAARATAALTLPALLALYAVASVRGSFPRRENPWGDLAFLVPWALGQQFALQTVLLRESQAVTSRRNGILLAAAVFGGLHLPNPFLAPVTLVAALGWCWVYDRHPNVLPLALSHALSTLVILYCYDPSVTGHLRVGYSYLLLD